MSHGSWLLQTCSPSAALESLAVVTTSLLILGYASSSFLLGAPAYEYDDGTDVVEAAGAGAAVPRRGPGYPPVLAYYISGGLYLDAGAGAYERARLAGYARSEREFLEYENVHVVGKGDPVDGRGASAVAAVLRGAAVLLRIGAEWDWLVTLGASDYPLITPDDLLYAFSVPRGLNFIDHRMDSGGAEAIVVDQILKQSTNAEISFSSGQRAKPDAFELHIGMRNPHRFSHGSVTNCGEKCTGSPWPILCRDFVEYCVVAPDNLPRTLLLYFSNSLSPMDFYFQTVMANSARFRNSTVNHSLRHTVARDGGYTAVAQDGGAPTSQGAGQGQASRYDAIVGSGAAFAGVFGDDDDALLQRIDEEVLGRPLDGVTPGEWCAGDGEEAAGEECSVGGDIDVVRHGAKGRRLATLMAGLVGAGQCDGCNNWAQ